MKNVEQGYLQTQACRSEYFCLSPSCYRFHFVVLSEKEVDGNNDIFFNAIAAEPDLDDSFSFLRYLLKLSFTFLHFFTIILPEK